MPTPAGLEAIVRVAMAKRRDDRYPTALALAADLDRFLAGERPIALGRVGARRFRVIMGGLAGALALGALGVAAALRGSGGVAAVESGQRASRSGGERGPQPVVQAALWDLPPGQQVAYDLRFVEVGGGQRIEFSATLALRSGPVADQRLPFDCRVTGLVCKLGVKGQPGDGLSYDSSARPLDPDHPLGMLQAAVGQPFTCALDVQTGEVVTMEGFREICARVSGGQRDALRRFVGLTLPEGTTREEQRALEDAAERSVDQTVNGVFNDAFIRESMDALTRVRGDAPRVPWRPAAAQDGLPAWRCGGSPQGVVLHGLTTPWDEGDGLVVSGESRYDRTSVAEAHLTQDYIRQGNSTCQLQWSMRRSDVPAPSAPR